MKTLSTFIALLCLVACTQPQPNLDGNTAISPDFTVSDVKVTKDYPETWSVNGMVRNNLKRPAQIAVKLKFLNANRDIVYSTLATINSFDAVPPGVAAPFHFATDPNKFDGVVDFDVQPYER